MPSNRFTATSMQETQRKESFWWELGEGEWGEEEARERGRPASSVGFFLCLKYLMSAPALLKYWLFSHIAGGDRRERRLFPRSNEKQKAVSIKLSSPPRLFIYFLFSFSISAIKGKHDPRRLRSGGGRHWGVKGNARRRTVESGVCSGG